MKHTKRFNFLHSMEIYGWEDVEDVVLASLVLKEPILLVGEHGSAKTYFAQALANAMGLSFYSYDASKGMFEDIIGFPNVKNNKVDYIGSPVTIWNKEVILVDEISRATPEMQNKWLEIIRSRTVMGLPIKSLRYIIAAMNPIGYMGVIGLDIALAERFAFTIKVPNIAVMNDRAKEKIIRNQTMSDRMGNKRGKAVKKNEKLIEFIDEKERIMHSLKGTAIDKKIVQFLKRFIPAAKNGRFSNFVNGRRESMMRKSVLAYLAVIGIEPSESYLEKLMEKLIPFIIPWYALDSGDISQPMKYLMNRIVYKWAVDEHSPYKNCESIDCLYKRFSSGRYEIFPFIVEKLKSILFEDADLKTEPIDKIAYGLKILIRLVKKIPNYANSVPVSPLDELKKIFLMVLLKSAKEWNKVWDRKEIQPIYEIFSYIFHFENDDDKKSFVNFIK